MNGFIKYLSPIFRDLDKVADVTDIIPTTELEQEEFPYIKELITLITQHIKANIQRMESLNTQIEHFVWLIDTETGDDKTDAIKDYNKLMVEMEKLINEINKQLAILDAPYFGKIRLNRHKSSLVPSKEMDVYIGKFAYFDKSSNEVKVSDWRAPIANIYYQNSGPTDNVSFSTPIGEQTGDLKQKRQFEASGGRINSIYDAKSGNVAADEFLLSQLNNRIGKKLSEIVATIQSQQNSIIREGINHPVLIQGVAGSGKTTIILHRLAYLFYTYEDEILTNKSLIIAPNKMFLDYISDVLPSLGVKGLEQNTYLFWARDILGFNEKQLLSLNPDNLEVMSFKGSDAFREVIDQYFFTLEREIFEKLPASVAFDAEERYYELKDKHPKMSMIERLDLSVEYAFAQTQFKSKRTGDAFGNFEEMQIKRKKIKDLVKKETDIYTLYKNLFLSDKALEWADISPSLWKKACADTKANFKTSSKGTKGYKLEDLAAMTWLHFHIHGYNQYVKHYIVVDEAQDLSVFQLTTLYKVANKGNITFAGDLAQSIIPPFYIRDWKDLTAALENVFEDAKTMEYHQLFRSYRTTIEIIEFANEIFKKFFPDSYRLPEAVLRHGQEVEILEFKQPLHKGNKDDIEVMISLLNSEDEKGAVTTAIVCRDNDHASAVLAALEAVKSRLNATLVNFEDDDYHSGILVLPVSRAKGLEFDSVIIADVNNEIYPGEELDVRLLYVAITRSLHRLYLITDRESEGSPLL